MISVARAVGYLGVVAIAVLSLLPGSWRPRVLAVSQFEHVAAYGAIGALLALGHPASPSVIALLLIAYAAALELGQLLVPGRTASLIDVAAGGLGALIGVILGSALQLR
jgi:VanZ family protein